MGEAAQGQDLMATIQKIKAQLDRWPDDYLSWERTMDDWFSYHGVPNNERLAQAIKQLSGKAYSWWKRVDRAQGKSPEEVVTNWEDLKWVMIRKYVSSSPSPEIRERYPRRFLKLGYKEARRVVPQDSQRNLLRQANSQPNQRHKDYYDQYHHYKVPKAMEKKFVSQDTLARSQEKSDKPIFQAKAMVSSILDKLVYKSSPTGMSHLSFQDTMSSMLLNDPKPVTKVSHQGGKMKAICLLKFQGKNQTISLAMNLLPSGNRKLKNVLFNCQGLRLCEIGLGTEEEYTAKKKETSTMMLQTAEPLPLKVSLIKKDIQTEVKSCKEDSQPTQVVQRRKSFFSLWKLSKFPSPSSSEYQPLEVDFSPAMKRPSPEIFMDFNMNVLDFQKARLQKNWSRENQDPITFPKPAKSTSIMESCLPP
ncbi:hypothetical protein F2Q68_00041264 [Brassica cretica]|uniref:Retrotransposon gag domain-containing protein n=1 Tax=Brassica cretica TaxID=69181 RepID=A0A8S9MJW3_BRACR|nr:hypothetical protein F2Q68_00041264 [Brassica cretica]